MDTEPAGVLLQLLASTALAIDREVALQPAYLAGC
jgi:hypothetical protein